MINLPKNEKTFMFSKVGEVTGMKYEGQFTVKCALSLADKRLIEIEKSRLSADLMNPTGNLDAISRVIANLRVRVITGPEWYNQQVNTMNILDEDIVFDVYGECLKAAEEWMKELKKESNKGEDQGNSQKGS
jgi:hypothetical protein